MSTLISKSVAQERLLHVSVGLAQIVLATIFAAMALLKLMMPPERLVETMHWTEQLPVALVRGFGALEFIAAVVVAAPAVTRLPQRIVGFTSLAFLTLMTSAAIVNTIRGEFRMVAINAAIAALAGFVAWGRLMQEPLESDVP